MRAKIVILVLAVAVIVYSCSEWTKRSEGDVDFIITIMLFGGARP